jgi:N-acetylglucosaminyldiphosphoundecaprenol N-acetyl-beta-D-mannosaminyltransferase
MGIPKQEKWITRHMDELRVPVCMGVGGSFDVFSGRVNRAPMWMQKRGLEWLYRLVKNPKKYTKVATLPVFALRVLTGKRLPGT